MKLSKKVVFIVKKAGQCSECGGETSPGQFIERVQDGIACLNCADLDHLEFLPSGNAALTRRSTKYSRLSAVVVKFSSARKRYERQGVLVEAKALKKAEAECLSDEDVRQERRKKDRIRRDRMDKKYITEFAKVIRAHYPNCPKNEEHQIAFHACQKYSGRIGRSSGAKEFDSKALELAVRAHVRHAHTQYDDLLMDGVGRLDARRRIGKEVDKILQKWKT